MRPRIVPTYATALAFLLSACNQVHQDVQLRTGIDSSTPWTLGTGFEVCADLSRAGDLDPIRNKLASPYLNGAHAPTDGMLDNQDKPPADDDAALKRLLAVRGECRAQQLAQGIAFPLAERLYLRQSDQVLERLADGALSYGGANAELRGIAQAYERRAEDYARMDKAADEVYRQETARNVFVIVLTTAIVAASVYVSYQSAKNQPAPNSGSLNCYRGYGNSVTCFDTGSYQTVATCNAGFGAIIQCTDTRTMQPFSCTRLNGGGVMC